MKQIVIATHNPGKILEYQAILQDYPLKLLTLMDLNIGAEPEEDGKTFEENAIKKANFYSQLVKNLPILAEDSGLEIDYLNGEPGIYSRRWLGRESSDEELIETAIKKLENIPMERRGAQFRVVMALKFPDPKIKIATSEGILRGFIINKPIKKVIPGYPFRSLFYVPSVGKVLGELSMENEAVIGHRKIALEKLAPFLLR